MKKLVITATIFVALVAAMTWVLQRPVDGVVPIVWDKTACDHCHMHIGEPGFAAQLQTKQGKIYNFDDPGCLFAFVMANAPDIKATYFHHHTEDRWLDQRNVGFIPVKQPTPMGYGLAAVEAVNHPEAMSFGEASNYVATHKHDASMKHAMNMKPAASNHEEGR